MDRRGRNLQEVRAPVKTQSSQVKAILKRTLHEAGFVGNASTWHKSLSETILVVDLQKSQYGPQYYLNLGIWLKQLGETQNPKEHQCHIRLRATSLPSEGAKLLERALDLEDMSMSAEQREKVIVEYMQSEVLPFMEMAATVEGSGTALGSGKLSRAMVHKQVRELLVAKAKISH